MNKIEFSIQDNPDAMGLITPCLLSWDDLCKKLTDHQVCDKGGTGFFVGGTFKSQQRKTENMTSRTMVTLDIDNYPRPIAELEVLLKLMMPYRWVAYSTHNYNLDSPSIRVVIPLKKPFADIGNFKSTIKDMFNYIKNIDDCSYKANQSMYFPTKPAQDSQVWTAKNEGELLLLEAKDTQNISAVSNNKDNDTLKKIKLALNKKSAAECNYDEWLKILMAAHKACNSDDSMQLCIEWSRKDSLRFKDGEIATKWRSFDADKENAVTLDHLLNNDFTEILRAEVARLNQNNAQVLIAGKNMVLTFLSTGETRELTLPAFVNIANGNYIQTGFDKRSKKPKYRNIHSAWLAHSEHTNYQEGVFFEPSRHGTEKIERAGWLNKWNGFKYKPQSGTLGFAEFDQLCNALCEGQKHLADYLINWIAWGIQNPALPAEVAVVFTGNEGTGKGTLAKILCKCWQGYSVVVNQSNGLTGNFNAQLSEKCFVFADEATFAGDHRNAGTLRNLVTEPVIAIERKGFEKTFEKNRIKLLIATNHAHAVFTSATDRRFFVCETTDTLVGNKEFWIRINKLIANEDWISELMYMLNSRDLSNFNIREYPKTSGVRTQREQSLAPHEVWLVECVDNGCIEFPHRPGDGSWHSRVLTGDLYKSYIEYCDKMKVTEYGRKPPQVFGKWLMKIGFKKYRNVGRHIEFGSLDEAKNLVSKALNYEFDVSR